MDVPVVAINMKTYPQSCGFGGQKLAELCEEVAMATARLSCNVPFDRASETAAYEEQPVEAKGMRFYLSPCDPVPSYQLAFALLKDECVQSPQIRLTGEKNSFSIAFGFYLIKASK